MGHGVPLQLERYLLAANGGLPEVHWGARQQAAKYSKSTHRRTFGSSLGLLDDFKYLFNLDSQMSYVLADDVR